MSNWKDLSRNSLESIGFNSIDSERDRFKLNYEEGYFQCSLNNYEGWIDVSYNKGGKKSYTQILQFDVSSIREKMQKLFDEIQ